MAKTAPQQTATEIAVRAGREIFMEDLRVGKNAREPQTLGG
jgi:hypothetical protein